MPVLPVRSPEPVNRPGTTSTSGAEHLLDRDARRHRLAGLERRQLLLPPGKRAARDARVELVALRPRFPRLARALRRGGPRRGSSASTSSGTKKSWSAGRPRISFVARDLVGAERVAVRLLRVGELRRRVADVRAQHDERRARRPRPCPRAARVRARRGRSAASPSCDDVPAVRREAQRDVVGVRELGRAVDRDVVVVVDEHQPAELEVTGERRGLVADAFHEVAVAADAEDVVVARRRRRSGRAGASRRSPCRPRSRSPGRADRS